MFPGQLYESMARASNSNGIRIMTKGTLENRWLAEIVVNTYIL